MTPSLRSRSRGTLALLVSAGLELGALRPAFAATTGEGPAEARPPVSVPSPLATPLMERLSLLASRPLATALPGLISDARSPSPELSRPAQLALALVVNPVLIASWRDKLPEAARPSLDALARSAGEAAARPELRSLLASARAEVSRSLENGDYDRTREALAKVFNEPSATPSGEPVHWLIPIEASNDLGPLALAPLGGTPAGEKRWRATVQGLKRASAKNDAPAEAAESAAARAAGYLRANPHAPEVFATLSKDLVFHRAVAALGGNSPAGAALKSEVDALVPPRAVEALLRARRMDRFQLALWAGAAVVLALTVPNSPLLAALYVFPAAAAQLALAARGWMELNTIDAATRPYREALKRIGSTEGMRAEAESRYQKLARRQVRLRKKARRLEAKLLGFSPEDPEAVQPGDDFDSGIEKLMRHPNDLIRAEAQYALNRRVAAEMIEARVSPDPARLSWLAFRLLRLWPERESWPEQKERLLERTRSQLNAAGFAHNDAFLAELEEHLEAARSRSDAPAPETALVPHPLRLTGLTPGARGLAAARAIMGAERELAEAGYARLTKLAFEYLQIFGITRAGTAPAPNAFAADPALLRREVVRRASSLLGRKPPQIEAAPNQIGAEKK